MLSPVRSSILAQLCKSPLSQQRQQPLFSRILRASFSSAPKRHLIRDNSYPYPLYYHLLTADNAASNNIQTPSHAEPRSRTSASDHSDYNATYVLSFLEAFPKQNPQIIGFLNHSTSSPDSEEEIEVRPNNFTENEAFNDLLHQVIQQNLKKDPMVEMVLQQQVEGWTHITDKRNPAPYGRTPLPEDIFGSVQILNGEIQPSTYQRMPSHRIVSSNGLFQLSEYLHDKLVKHLTNL
ncbi:hypothetical protein BX616_002235 [Lobosporangium transversale]|uniref:Uncharacterized protein n=1 Tax=Lobosporangium transversale TaxID=64571 RepID=A0A1Y2GZP0_9FUNG|nr:hypothetical protein BCR41DRAFT_331460 [Lobosporangium transversale]KAF9901504.1 hypothetical protein BX616_002235 [Lobosporangium transversale]ORZ27769.1 hypothetical protein BCR41DRAFT_331460 [Lobosporangium transversale]|eukprot:XP_021885472.1 hypothetical protein BCR41DRAFT_331460 [Lobosporangium transversale]